MTHLVWEHLCWGASGVGLEHLSVRSGAGDGVIAWVEEDGRLFRLAYELEWDPGWIFRRIGVGLTGGAAGTLELARAPDGRWTRNGEAAPGLERFTRSIYGRRRSRTASRFEGFCSSLAPRPRSPSRM